MLKCRDLGRRALPWAPAEAPLMKPPKFPKVEMLAGRRVRRNSAVRPRSLPGIKSQWR